MSDTEHEYFEDFYECDGCQSRHRVGVECPLRNPHELLAQLTAAQQRVAELEKSRDAWEKHYNEMSNKKDADIHRLEIERELLEKRELALRTQLVALYSCRQPDPGIADWYTIRITKAHAERIMEALTK